jgi:hypothetical protein
VIAQSRLEQLPQQGDILRRGLFDVYDEGDVSVCGRDERTGKALPRGVCIEPGAWSTWSEIERGGERYRFLWRPIIRIDDPIEKAGKPLLRVSDGYWYM